MRLDQLEEGVQCLRGLLHDDVTDFAGAHFTLTNARNEPRPVQAKLPIWIGGGGEKRTLKIAAKYADGWNVPFIGPDTFAHKRSVLHGFCDSVGRDPAQIRCAINVGSPPTRTASVSSSARSADLVRPGVLTGSDDEILDRIGQYVDAGADQLNISLRAPFDLGAARAIQRRVEAGVNIHVRAPGPGQPDRRSHRLHRRPGAADGHRPVDRDPRYRSRQRSRCTSADEPEPAVIDLHVDDPRARPAAWARYVAGVVAEMQPRVGITGTVATDIPIGAGLSSSAALEVAVALALGFDGDASSLAQLCRRAEIAASGVPCGIMDQLAIAAGVAGHALLIDCGDLTVEPVRIPDDVEIVVAVRRPSHAGRQRLRRPRRRMRRGRGSRSARCAPPRSTTRRRSPIRSSGPGPTTWSARTNASATSPRRSRRGDLRAAGALMVASHDSLRDLYDTSTPVMDAAVDAPVASARRVRRAHDRRRLRRLCRRPHRAWSPQRTAGSCGQSTAPSRVEH